MVCDLQEKGRLGADEGSEEDNVRQLAFFSLGTSKEAAGATAGRGNVTTARKEVCVEMPPSAEEN